MRTHGCDPPRISCRKLLWRGPIGEFTPRWAHRSPEADGDTRRESLVHRCANLAVVPRRKDTVGYSYYCMIGVTFDTAAARRKCNAVHASIARNIGVTINLDT